MQKIEDRWRGPGIRLAILALVVVGIYFLVIFISQSWRLYELSRELRVSQAEVDALERQTQRLADRVEEAGTPHGRRLLVKIFLPYHDEGEKVAVLVVGREAVDPFAEEEPAALVEEGERADDPTSQPPWRQWWQVLFPPAVVEP